MPQKKATVKMDVTEKSVEKMQTRGRSCFLQHARNTTHLKVRKDDPKIQPLIKHPKHNYHPKMRLCTTR